MTTTHDPVALHPYALSTPEDYLALLKPGVMSLVVFTGWIGLWLAPGGLHPLLQAVAVLCIALGSGSGGAINMWFDRDIDAIMNRTKHRPLPAGRVDPANALSFGIATGVLSVALMGLALNWAAAALLAIAILFYVFIYTIWLKRRTPQNIVIGGAAGAFPPMIGWACVTGDVSLEPLLLFLIIFLWTPPHFWALALYRNSDYARAGVPMLPVMQGEAATKKQIVIYSVLLVAVTLMLSLLGTTGWPYALGASLLGVYFLWYAWQVRRTTGDRAPKTLFFYSILYLFLLFALLGVDRALTRAGWVAPLAAPQGVPVLAEPNYILAD